MSGQINVSSGTGTIRSSDDHNSQLFFFNWSVLNNIVIPANIITYIGVEYNSGNPIVNNRSTDNWNYHDEFPLGTVVFENNVLHIELNPQFVSNFAAHGLQRFYETFPLHRDDRNGGLILGETGTREITVTSGALWDRVTEFNISSIDTSDTDTFDCYHRNGTGGFTLIGGETQWNNTHYDNNGETLTELTVNKHANIFFYLETDGELVCVHGRVQHNTFAQALMEDVPNTLPLRITAHGKLIGRLTFQKSAGTAEEIESVFTTVFTASGVSDHGNLAGLTDDDHTQYLLADGTRALSANWNQGNFNLTSLTSWFLGKVNGNQVNNNLNWLNSTQIEGLFNSTSWNRSGTNVFLSNTGDSVGIGTNSPGRLFEIFGSASVFRFRDSGATASSTTAFIEFGGTDAGVWNRTGWVGDGSSANTDISLRAEVGDLLLADSSGVTMTLSGGDATFSGTLDVQGTDTTITNAVNPSFITTDTTNTVSTVMQSQNAIGFIGTSTNHPLVLMSNGSEHMRIMSGGNVGIGTQSPDYLGEFSRSIDNSGTVNDPIDATVDGSIIYLANSNANVNAWSGLGFGARSEVLGSGDTWWLQSIHKEQDDVDFRIGWQDSSDASINTALYIDSTGNVGIGTTSPDALLHVGSNTEDTLFHADGSLNDVTFEGTSSGTAPIWNFTNSATWAATRFYVEDANTVAGRRTFDFRSAGGATVLFYGEADGQLHAPSIRNEDGNDVTLCYDAGDGEIVNGGASCGGSSIRFKEQVQNTTYGLDAIMKLNPISFNWKNREDMGNKRSLGFTAEEMNKIIPEVVEYNETGQPFGIDYNKLTVPLTKAIQELKTENDLMKESLCKLGEIQWC